MMLGDSTMYQPYISLVVLMGYDVPPLHGNDTSSETFFRSFVQPRLHQLKGKKQTPSPYFVHEFEKSSTVLSYTHAVNMRDNSKLMQRVRALETYAKRSASVVIVGQDLHLLQLWPKLSAVVLTKLKGRKDPPDALQCHVLVQRRAWGATFKSCF